MSKCPLLMAAAISAADFEETHIKEWSVTDCHKKNCELWNDHFGRCSFGVDAFLKGNEDWRREKEDERRLRD